MNETTCPKCQTTGLSRRISKNGKPYFAHVETYPNGVSYFRRLHTWEECDAAAEKLAARADEEHWFKVAERDLEDDYYFADH